MAFFLFYCVILDSILVGLALIVYLSAMKRLFIYFFILLLVASCGTGTKTTTYTIQNAAFESAGPYFEGANTFTYSHTIDPSLLADSLGFSLDKTHSVRLKSVNIKPAEGQSLNDYGSFALAFMGNTSASISAAVLNPLPENTQVAALGVSAETDAAAFFKEGTFYLVLDTDFKADKEETVAFLVDLVFEITY